ncbi:protein YecE [Enterobacter asburiae]|uniref:Protein YecE n=1 Tax=Enterobacter asburiae TaxID=61645 RepID=A0A376FAA5_ENTAS|nr:protein YecE [Enterobacter asburiae]
MQQNQAMFAVWLQTLAKWEHTTTPYLFLHTPDIAQAPELVDALWQALQAAVPSVAAPLPSHNNLLFSDITPYHSEGAICQKQGVCMVSALYAVLGALLAD